MVPKVCGTLVAVRIVFYRLSISGSELSARAGSRKASLAVFTLVDGQLRLPYLQPSAAAVRRGCILCIMFKPRRLLPMFAFVWESCMHRRARRDNLVWNLGRWSWIRVWNLRWSWVLKVQQMEVPIEGIITGLFLNYAQIILFLRSHNFGTFFHLIFLYIVGYN